MAKPENVQEVMEALKEVSFEGMFALFSPTYVITEEPPGTYRIVLILNDVPARDPNDPATTPIKYGEREFRVLRLSGCPIVVTADQLAVPDAPEIFGTWQETLARKLLEEMVWAYMHEVKESGRYRGKLIDDPHAKKKP